MTCPRCGQAVGQGARFCRHCGQPTEPGGSDTGAIHRQDTIEDSRQLDPLLGQTLDAKYELVARLGEGGMGAVYRARRLHLGDEVAVKVLRRDLVRDSQSVERFRREARAAAMIRHSNVVTIHDFGLTPAPAAPAYIVMELVPGLSLRHLISREGRLAPARAVALMGDVCAGVGIAHRQGVVHRDLKPDNVIVMPPGGAGEREMAKVVDFGLAKLHGTAAELGLTNPGAVVGTPYYMAPEQCRAEPLDVRSDVYSLGAMFYEMLAGAPPFCAPSLAGVITQHLNDPPPPLPPGLRVPPALEAVCRRALAKDPAARQADATALGRELQAALALPAEDPSAADVTGGWPARPIGHSMMPTLPLASAPPDRARLKWAAVGFSILLLGAAGAIAAVMYLRPAVADRGQQAAPATPNSPPITAAEPAAAADGDRSAGSRDLVGRWAGTYGLSSRPATLVIKDYAGGKFGGILEQDGIRVAITGRVDAGTRRVTIKETQVLSGSGWSLGENTGELSADGRQMSGTGRDEFGGALGISYPWSFSRR